MEYGEVLEKLKKKLREYYDDMGDEIIRKMNKPLYEIYDWFLDRTPDRFILDMTDIIVDAINPDLYVGLLWYDDLGKAGMVLVNMREKKYCGELEVSFDQTLRQLVEDVVDALEENKCLEN